MSNLLAQNSDSLLQEVKQARDFAKRWEETPGTENDKFLAITKAGVPIQISDTVKTEDYRWYGFFISKKFRCTRWITYNPDEKTFSQSIKEEEVKGDLEEIVYTTIITAFLIIFLILLVVEIDQKQPVVAWFLWIVGEGLFIFFSYYLGSIFGLGALIYLFQDRLKLLFKKRKKKEGKTN